MYSCTCNFVFGQLFDSPTPRKNDIVKCDAALTDRRLSAMADGPEVRGAGVVPPLLEATAPGSSPRILARRPTSPRRALAPLALLGSSVTKNFRRQPLLPAALTSESAETLGPMAERASWVWKEGTGAAAGGRQLVGMDPRFDRRWCLLVPPAPRPEVEISGDATGGVRYLLFFEDKSAARPLSGLVLPAAGYVMRDVDTPSRRRATSRNASRSIRLEVHEGPSAGHVCVLTHETADIHFSWAQAFRAGADHSARPPTVHEARVMANLVAQLPTSAGGTDSVPLDASGTGPNGGGDASLLLRVWAGLGAPREQFAPVSPRWKEFGFQSEDPLSDLRGCGRLALRQLVAFIEGPHAATALAMCAAQLAAGQADCERGFPWATASVIVTDMLCQLAQITMPQGVHSQRSRRFCRSTCWGLLLASEAVFNELHALLFECLAAHFRQPPYYGRYLEFSACLLATREIFAGLLLLVPYLPSPTASAASSHSNSTGAPVSAPSSPSSDHLRPPPSAPPPVYRQAPEGATAESASSTGMAHVQAALEMVSALRARAIVAFDVVDVNTSPSHQPQPSGGATGVPPVPPVAGATTRRGMAVREAAIWCNGEGGGAAAVVGMPPLPTATAETATPSSAATAGRTVARGRSATPNWLSPVPLSPTERGRGEGAGAATASMLSPVAGQLLRQAASARLATQATEATLAIEREACAELEAELADVLQALEALH